MFLLNNFKWVSKTLRYDCPNHQKCVRNEAGRDRHLKLSPRPLYETLAKTRKMLSAKNERLEYQNRAGIEGTLSQGVHRSSLRRSRYRWLQKTHLQEVATATGINLLRTINFLNEKPIAKNRVARFAKLDH